MLSFDRFRNVTYLRCCLTCFCNAEITACRTSFIICCFGYVRTQRVLACRKLIKIIYRTFCISPVICPLYFVRISDSSASWITYSRSRKILFLSVSQVTKCKYRADCSLCDLKVRRCCCSANRYLRCIHSCIYRCCTITGSSTVAVVCQCSAIFQIIRNDTLGCACNRSNVIGNSCTCIRLSGIWDTFYSIKRCFQTLRMIITGIGICRLTTGSNHRLTCIV